MGIFWIARLAKAWEIIKVSLNIFVVSPIKIVIILVLMIPWLCVLLTYEDIASDAMETLLEWKL